MTDDQTPGGWPGAPGVPLNSHERGVHWLWRASDGWVLHRWNPDERQYYGNGDVFGPDWAGRRWTYGGAVLTPAEVAAREAAAKEAGMRQAAGIVRNHAAGLRAIKHLRDADAVGDAAAAIDAAIEKKEPTT